MKPSHVFLAAISFSLLLMIANRTDAQNIPDKRASLLSTQPFQMPDSAVDAGIDGNIKVGFTIASSGKAKSVEILAGPAWPCGVPKPKKEIAEVLDLVKRNIEASQFSPATKDQKPISVEAEIMYSIGDAYQAAMRKRQEEKLGLVGKTIKGGVINGRAISLPKPYYPPNAAKSWLTGSVKIEVVIDNEGNVVQAGAVDGPEVLQESAREAACRAKFSPTLVDGQPVNVSGSIVYNFMR
jgi:TonB family protein